MGAKLIKYSKFCFSLFALIIIKTLFNEVYSQNCNQNLDFSFTPSKAGAGVNWAQFPEFSLPFKVIYGGSWPNAILHQQIKRGFTHFSNPSNLKLVPPSQRAYVIYNVVSAEPLQPWYLERNPWGNNMTQYTKHWDNQILDFKNSTTSELGQGADLLILDIERQIKSDDSILVLKNSVYTPQDIKNLPSAQFIKDYKKALQDLYTTSAIYYSQKLNGSFNAYSSYSDAPVLNTFINIQGKKWDQWKTEKSSINYLTQDFNTNQVGGGFYNIQSFMTPSAYFYYDYPHPFAGEYLSYLLFQLEANRAWTQKDLILFVWQKYSFNPEFVLKKIRPWMAEAMAIFPFFAGAKGLFFWEDTSSLKENEDLSNYEYFTKGLYRLSKFKQFFEGSYTLIESTSARDYNENRLPIWRGVLKNNKLLVTAHNPNASSENQEVELIVKAGNWQKNIKLKGYEIFLCEYDLSIPTSNNPENIDLVVFPNPTKDYLKIRGDQILSDSIEIKLLDTNGKVIVENTIFKSNMDQDFMLKLPSIKASTLFLEIKSDQNRFYHKVLIHE